MDPRPDNFTAAEQEALRRLVAAALEEDLGTAGDITTAALFGQDTTGSAVIIARQDAVVAGLPAAESVFRALDAHLDWRQPVADGTAVSPGDVLAEVRGNLRSMLAGERTALNFLIYLSGIATLTRRYVEAVAGTAARIYDTRKTLPGWRLLAKYAVRAGGGCNHRTGLWDAVLVKDNHLAAMRRAEGREPRAEDGEPAPAASLALLEETLRRVRQAVAPDVLVIVEADTLEQLRALLSLSPEVVLLDNMSPAVLREAVALRDRLAPEVILEASGGISLQNVRAVAETGVDRISVGALTHSAPAVDIALDWKDA